MKLKRSAVAIAAALACSAPAAHAEIVDPSVPRVIFAGAPLGFAPAERIDARRSGRSPHLLPADPVQLWRRHLSGGVELPPVVDARGAVIVAETIPEVVAFAADGHELFRARIGGAPTAPPVLTSAGTIVVLTATGQAFGLSPAGATRFATSLGVRGRDLDTAPAATDEGGFIVAAGFEVLALDGDGVVRARADLPDRAVGAVIPDGSGALVTTESGAVYAFEPPQAPRLVGSFGGAPRRGSVRADARTLLAVVDHKALVALDLPTGTTQVRAASAAASGYFDAPPTIGHGGPFGLELALVSTFGGALVGIDAAGHERLRAGLERSSTAPSPLAGTSLASFIGTIDLKPSPPLVVDREGRVAFARASGRVGVVAPGGLVAIASERLCNGPVAVVPAGDARMLVACRDGSVWMLGERGSIEESGEPAAP